MAFKFEDLRVWQKALDLTEEVHRLTLSFPKNEMFVLTSQIKRAADSVALNIAEGSTGQSDKEFARFLGIALRSGIEVVSCLYIGRRRELIGEEQFEKLYNHLTEITKMIQTLRNSLK
ncbi:four helix bundle protein [Roseivirga sp.]|uniref:four helix bundle protein n=1 Tax=Roseivirga sp. TaxID=1964215 RepID=UPI003B5200F0